MWALAAACAVVILGIVFGLLNRRDRKEAERVWARLGAFRALAEAAEDDADALSAPALSGSESADVLDRLRDG